MTIGNIPAWQRSQIKQIFLVALIYERDIKKCGYSKILEPIVNDIKQIESEGICLKMMETERTIKGSVMCLIGDNLESDGTLIDDSEVLRLLQNETLILLEESEQWIPISVEFTNENRISLQASPVSLPSTVSITSDLDMSPLPSSMFINQSGSENSNQSNPIYVEIKNVVANTEHLWDNFEIPWHKIPTDMLDMCAKVVNELRDVKEAIPSKVLKRVANEMCVKYPLMFRDSDQDGLVVADGSCTIFCKLQERASYLRRPHKRNSSSPLVPPRLSKRKTNIMSGCVQWEENVDPNANIPTDKDVLNNMVDTGEEFFRLLEQTYPAQRQFLNDIVKPPTINEILNILTSKAQKIIEFGIGIKKIGPKLNMTEKDLHISAMNFFSSYFKEDIKYFLDTSTGLNQHDSGVDIISEAPCIHIIGERKTYSVFVEKEQVFETPCHLTAMEVAFGLFYILNLEYPREISQLLEFIQRFFFKIHPDAGSRSKKNMGKRRVISLINKIKDL
nr:uncharacterized protein LOC111415310 [Onthophagus taurus]